MKSFIVLSVTLLAGVLGAIHAAETVAEFLREERRLLEGCEVAALVELVPVNDVRIDLFEAVFGFQLAIKA